jgi:glycosyltransferase involved in cell wall biosynthesis
MIIESVNKRSPKLINDPSVTVIIRSNSKSEASVKATLDSLVSQTFVDFEVILVENGEKQYLNLLAKKIDNLELVYTHIREESRSKAGNRGLELARGKYLCFLDDDDIFLPHHLETLWSAIDANCKIRVVYGKSLELKKKGTRKGEYQNGRMVGRTPFSVSRIWIRNQLPIQSVMFHRSLYEKLGGFDERLEFLEDWDLWIRYSSEYNFYGLDLVTSIFYLPNSRQCKKRAASHRACIQYVYQKHEDLSCSLNHHEIISLKEDFLESVRFVDLLVTLGKRVRNKFLAVLWRYRS